MTWASVSSTKPSFSGKTFIVIFLKFTKVVFEILVFLVSLSMLHSVSLRFLLCMKSCNNSQLGVLWHNNSLFGLSGGSGENGETSIAESSIAESSIASVEGIVGVSSRGVAEVVSSVGNRGSSHRSRSRD